jgi:hypothetical protein
MAYRFTNTEKWEDSWFSSLKQIEMLLFIYLCDNCDIAGFAEVNLKRWASDLNSNPDTIEGALKGLQRGIITSKEGDAIYLRNFLKHQKNLPLNPNNKAHIGIMRRFELYRNKFDIEDINTFIESPIVAPLKGLERGTGNGIGNGIGNGKGIKGGVGEKEETYTFEQFWTDYDKKVGDKKKLEAKWAKIPEAEKKRIFEYIPAYKDAQPNKKYRKNPETFLNNKSWNDEIIKANTGDCNRSNGAIKAQGITDNQLAEAIRRGTARALKENARRD